MIQKVNYEYRTLFREHIIKIVKVLDSGGNREKVG